MTAEGLRERRGVTPVAGPSGVAITTRLHTSGEDEVVLDAVADHVGGLRRADLAAVCRRQPPAAGLDGEARRRVRREQLNNRKGRLTAQSCARWANAIIGANDNQYRLSREAQYRHIIGLRAAIARPTYAVEFTPYVYGCHQVTALVEKFALIAAWNTTLGSRQ